MTNGVCRLAESFPAATVAPARRNVSRPAEPGDVWLGTMRVMLQAPDSVPRRLGSPRHHPNSIGSFGMRPRKCLHFQPSPASRPHGWRGRRGGEGGNGRFGRYGALVRARNTPSGRQAPAPASTVQAVPGQRRLQTRTSIVVLGEGPPPPPWRRGSPRVS